MSDVVSAFFVIFLFLSIYNKQLQKYNNIVMNAYFCYIFNDFVRYLYKTIIFAKKKNLWHRKKYRIHL